jgi:phosphoribosyl 1,2-cyclic phosphate phosphodiesterase
VGLGSRRESEACKPLVETRAEPGRTWEKAVSPRYTLAPLIMHSPRPVLHPRRDLSGQLLFLGTGTSVGVPVVGCGCVVCSGGDPRNQRTRTSVALGLPGGTLLIDTTPDLRMQLLRERLGGVDALLYTHDHVDHVYGLDDIRPICFAAGKPLPVYCEERVERRIRKAFDYAFETLPIPGGGLPKVTFERITSAPFDLLGVRVVPLPLRHGSFDVLGFRFGGLAYCTDTNEIPTDTWPLLEGLDTLILDCLRPERHPTHFSIDEALAVAARVAARRTLFVHMSHDIDHAAMSAGLPAGVEFAYDGLTVPLGRA